MKRPRGDRSTSAKIEERRARTVELIKQGKTKSQVAEELSVSRSSVWRDLRALTERFGQENSAAFVEFRKAQLAVFELMERSLVEGKIDAQTATAWRGIRSEISGLLGLNAESRAVVAHVSASDSAPYLAFKKSSSGLSEAQLAEVLRFAESLPRTEPERDETWFPKPAPKEIEG